MEKILPYMLPYADLTDHDLTSLLAAHDENAFAEVYDRYWSVLYLYACKFSGRNDITEDIVQDVFISLWNRSEPLVLKSTLASYLYTAVRFKIFDAFDHEKIKEKHIDSLQLFINAGSYVTDEIVREKELIKLVEAGVNTLPLRMREVFTLSRNKGLSQKEIAHQLNISDKTVKKQMSKALKILRLKLEVTTVLLLLITKYIF